MYGFGNIATSSASSGGFGSVGSSANEEELQYLSKIGIDTGLEKDVNKILETTPRLSFLQRLGKGLGAFNPAEAILTGTEKGLGAGIQKYASGVAQGIESAVTGKDYEGERRMFADVVDKLGVKNSVAKFGLGVLGDILLDPSTYFGGALAKAGVKVASKGVEIGLKGIGKVAPKVETGLRLAGTGLKEAAGKAFVYGYGTSKGLAPKALEIQSQLGKAQEGIITSNIGRLGTGTLSKSQQEELVAKLLGAKRGEYEFGQRTLTSSMEQINKLYPELKVADEISAKKVLGSLEQITSKQIEKIREETDKIVRPFFEARQAAVKSGRLIEGVTPELAGVGRLGFSKIDDLNRVVDGLKNQLKELRTGRNSVEKLSAESIGQEITKEELVNVGNRLVRYEEDRLSETIDSLASQIEKLKSRPKSVSAVSPKIPKASDAQILVEAERIVSRLQSSLADKERLLQTVLAPRRAAGKLIEEARRTGDFSKIPTDIAEHFDFSRSSPEVQKAIQEQAARSQKFAGQAGIADPYQIYFPGLKDESIKNFIQNTRSLRVGSEDYLKQFKNLLTDEQLIRDPAQAFATREYQIAHDNIVRSQLKGIVRDFGKPLSAFKNLDEAKAAGYRLLKEEGTILGKDVGYVLENDFKFLDNLLSKETPTIDALAKATGYDAMTALFKRSVTGLFAPFHIRNFVSGQIQNFEVLGPAALNPKNMYIGQRVALQMAGLRKFPNTVINIGGKQTTLRKLIEPLEKRFGGSSSYLADIKDATRKGSTYGKKILSSERLKYTLKTAGLGQESIPFKIARGVGNYIETQQKATAYITALSQGKTINEALELATRAGFDYRALTPFESRVMRRIIPFYSFTRKNLELQLRTLGENPQRINQILATIGNLGDRPTAEEKKDLPQYIKDSLAIKLKDSPEGLKNFIYGFGTPIESFTNLFSGASAPTLQKKFEGFILSQISTMNPILKVPVELGIGKDSFRKKDLKDVYSAQEYSAAPQFIKDLLDIKEVQKPILTKDSKGKLRKTGERTDYVADPARLLLARSLFTSRGVTYLDQVFDGDLQGLAKALKLTTGLKPQSIDLEQSASIQERDKIRELQDLLLRTGKVSQFRRVFVPKESSGFGSK